VYEGILVISRRTPFRVIGESLLFNIVIRGVDHRLYFPLGFMFDVAGRGRRRMHGERVFEMHVQVVFRRQHR
jgi:hypothetical protein